MGFGAKPHSRPPVFLGVFLPPFFLSKKTRGGRTAHARAGGDKKVEFDGPKAGKTTSRACHNGGRGTGGKPLFSPSRKGVSPIQRKAENEKKKGARRGRSKPLLGAPFFFFVGFCFDTMSPPFPWGKGGRGGLGSSKSEKKRESEKTALCARMGLTWLVCQNLFNRWNKSEKILKQTSYTSHNVVFSEVSKKPFLKFFNCVFC